jgi:hypothetical protein
MILAIRGIWSVPMGHEDVSTTQIPTYVLNHDPSAVRSPVETILGT